MPATAGKRKFASMILRSGRLPTGCDGRRLVWTLNLTSRISRHSGKAARWRLFLTLLGRYVDMRRVREAKYTCSALMREIQSHGYQVETYQFPFIEDERAVRSSVLERLTGIVDVRGDREVLMLYTSFNPSLDSALIWVYGPEAQSIAVGSTTGPASDPHFARLNWEEFSRDLMVANHFSHVIGVYNLGGCVRQGFLARLKT